jgi:RimJ/RimL family protein N-acetyltransferase
MTSLRRATPDDYAVWYELRVAVAGEGVWIGAELPVVRDGAAFAARLERPDVAVILAEENDVLVGTIAMEVGGGIASFAMWVLATARGRGIGRALLDACVAWSADVGAHKITLEVWPHNGAAMALYRSAGFEIEGRKRRHYRRRNGQLWDSVLMAKILDLTAPGSELPDAFP